MAQSYDFLSKSPRIYEKISRKNVTCDRDFAKILQIQLLTSLGAAADGSEEVEKAVGLV